MSPNHHPHLPSSDEANELLADIILRSLGWVRLTEWNRNRP
jgi:hypothetical protein